MFVLKLEYGLLVMVWEDIGGGDWIVYYEVRVYDVDWYVVVCDICCFVNNSFICKYVCVCGSCIGGWSCKFWI